MTRAQRREADISGGSDTIFVIDVGGTWVRSGTWERGRGLLPHSVRKEPTAAYLDKDHPDPLGHQLLRMLVHLVPPGTPRSSVSLGAAMHQTKGTLYASAPLSGQSTAVFPLVQELRETRPETEWHLVNDVTAALLAYQDGSPDAAGDKVLVTTVSTGIAARLYLPDLKGVPLDAAGLQGEIGHLPAATSQLDLKCACGGMNHVASYSSGPGIQQTAQALMQKNPSESRRSIISRWPDHATFEHAFASALDASDSFAHLILQTAIQPLADVFSYALTIDPSIDRLVLVGGVIEAIGDHYRESIIARMASDGIYLTPALSPDWVSSKVQTSAGDPNANLLGAAVFSEKGHQEQLK
jgi:predicted NBD/HSP70 family sugar kinase